LDNSNRYTAVLYFPKLTDRNQPCPDIHPNFASFRLWRIAAEANR
jgi:hypothetical protein